MKRNNTLSRRLLEEAKKRDTEEFNELVKKGVFKENDYTWFVICKYCNNNENGSCVSKNECPVMDTKNRDNK